MAEGLDEERALEWMQYLRMCENGPIPLPGPDFHRRSSETKRKLPDYIMVAAIDFGTTYSGYAFAMKNKSDIKMNKNWGAEFGSTSYKTPTSVLVDPDKKFCSFGFDAQQQYAELMEKEDQRYYYFERFKMALHNKKDLGKSTSIKAANGKSMPALDIFGMALGYLRGHLTKTVNSTIDGEIDENMIRWVITVPAIWSDASKQFMREAAVKGGLIKEVNSDHLMIALEPEAASLYVRKMDISSDCDVSGIKTGTKYLVIDAGGGTLDVTCHELQANGTIKELYYATGGAHGGSKVDEQFEKLLGDIFTSKFMKNYKKKNASQFLQLLIDFEKRKKACEKNKPSGLNVSIPWSFGASLYEYAKKDIVRVIKEYSASGVSFNNGLLRLDGNVVTSLFKPVTDDVVKHLEELLKNDKLKDVEYLFCVGGFNESKYLQDVLQDTFSKRFKIVIPEEASLAVVKGAIFFGQDPNVIGSRVSSKTYGVQVAQGYIPFLHDPNRLIRVSGRVLCTGIFKKYVTKGQDVSIGYSETMITSPLTPHDKEAEIAIHSSDDVNPQYVTDSGVQELGTVKVKWDGFGLDRKMEVTMTFGGTEITVEAVTFPKKNKAQTTVTFLS